MPNKSIKNNKFTINNTLNLENDLPNNHKISKNSNNNKILNDSFLNAYNFKNAKNIIANKRAMTEYKTKNKAAKNDLSWDYGIGILNKGDQMNFYLRNNNIKNKNNYILNNYL